MITFLQATHDSRSCRGDLIPCWIRNRNNFRFSLMTFYGEKSNFCFISIFAKFRRYISFPPMTIASVVKIVCKVWKKMKINLIISLFLEFYSLSEFSKCILKNPQFGAPFIHSIVRLWWETRTSYLCLPNTFSSINGVDLFFSVRPAHPAVSG